MTESPVTVSDHALIRYLERSIGLNFDNYRKEILTPEIELAILTCGDGRYPINGDMKAVVRDNTIVTIMGKNDVA